MSFLPSFIKSRQFINITFPFGGGDLSINGTINPVNVNYSAILLTGLAGNNTSGFPSGSVVGAWLFINSTTVQAIRGQADAGEGDSLTITGVVIEFQPIFLRQPVSTANPGGLGPKYFTILSGFQSSIHDGSGLAQDLFTSPSYFWVDPK